MTHVASPAESDLLNQLYKFGSTFAVSYLDAELGELAEADQFSPGYFVVLTYPNGKTKIAPVFKPVNEDGRHGIQWYPVTRLDDVTEENVSFSIKEILRELQDEAVVKEKQKLLGTYSLGQVKKVLNLSN